MKTCTFFGHRDCPEQVMTLLEDAVKKLLELGVNVFLVGNNGAFDRMASAVLEKYSAENKNIEYYIVPAYFSENAEPGNRVLYPDGFESFPKRFAVDRRNNYLLSRADVVVAYVTHPGGGADKFVKLAKSRGKMVINLGERE